MSKKKLPVPRFGIADRLIIDIDDWSDIEWRDAQRFNAVNKNGRLYTNAPGVTIGGELSSGIVGKFSHKKSGQNGK